MSNIYRPEGALISTLQNKEYISSLSGLERAMTDGIILESAVLFCDSAMRLHVDLGEVCGIIRRDKLLLWLKIIVACLPAAAVGLLFDDTIDEYFYNSVTVGTMLILVGAAFIFVESRQSSSAKNNITLDGITFKKALLIGVFQLLAAVFPGTSRSGSTILGGLMLGIPRTVAAEFTFFLGIPVMFGASLLKLVKFGFDFTGTELIILAVGMISAFGVSMVCIRFLMDYIKRHSFKVFGIYRIILGAAVLLYFALR